MTDDNALAKCGKYALAGGVTPKLTAKGRAYLSGVATCGKVHLCPVCAATIRSARARELQAAGVAWETLGGAHSDILVAAKLASDRIAKAAADGTDPAGADLIAVERADGVQAGGLAMLTLTMRHYLRHALTELVGQQREAWKRALGQNAGRAWRAAKASFGVVGFVRAWECTHGPENGWHPHWHVLVFFDRPLTPEEGGELEEIIYGVWSAALKAVGAYLPGREHGVRLDLSGHGEGGALARYLMKYQDGKTGWTTGAEMTRQDVKTGRDGHRTPFEIARTFLDEDAADGDEYARDRDLWQAYEAGASGLRSLYWSNGLRKRLAPLVELDNRTDGQLAAAEDATASPVAVILADPWHRHIAPRRGRSLALLKAAEKDGVQGVRAIVEKWGLVWGVDVIDPPAVAPETVPTAAEVLAEREHITMAARMEVWRQELERQDRAHRLKAAEDAVEYAPGAWEARQRRMEEQRDDQSNDQRDAAHAEFRRRLRLSRAGA